MKISSQAIFIKCCNCFNTGFCYIVSAKYSCGFSNLLDSSIIVNER
nr:MAG TPA: hypothetical protein [Caudoviricetes sp.]